MNHLRFALAATIGLTFLVFAACGAENDVAPAAEVRADIRECQGFEQLMPNFLSLISQGKTANLKRLIEEQLLVTDREGVPPPINDVLRAIFRTLTTFALKPPEPGATGGAFCAPTSAPPPLPQANELCELRRALDVLVHQGKGIEAVQLVEPQLSTIVNYVTGTGVDCKSRPRTAHYEVAGVLSQFCAQNANCQLSDGLDMAIGFTDYVNTPDGKLLVQHLGELAAKPSITGLLNPQALREDDTLGMVRTLVGAIQSIQPMDLRNAFNSLPLPDQVKTDLQPVVGDLEKLLQHPEIMTPLRRSLNCLTMQDRNLDTVRMVYRVAIEEQCSEFGLTRLTELMKGLQEVDQRGSLVFIIGTLARSIRSDELAIDSTAKVCRTIFTTARGPGQAQSNAQLALPVVGDMLRAGVINEGICAADTLLFGCVGGGLPDGGQPACR